MGTCPKGYVGWQSSYGDCKEYHECRIDGSCRKGIKFGFGEDFVNMKMLTMDIRWKMINLQEKLLPIHIKWVYLIKPLAIHFHTSSTTTYGTHTRSEQFNTPSIFGRGPMSPSEGGGDFRDDTLRSEIACNIDPILVHSPMKE